MRLVGVIYILNASFQLKAFLFSILTLTSVISFIYLQSQEGVCLTNVPAIEQVEIEENSSLPDAEILTTIVKKTKKYIFLDL